MTTTYTVTVATTHGVRRHDGACSTAVSDGIYWVNLGATCIGYPVHAVLRIDEEVEG